MRLLIALYFYLRIVRRAFHSNMQPISLVQNNTYYFPKPPNQWDALLNHPFNENEW